MLVHGSSMENLADHVVPCSSVQVITWQTSAQQMLLPEPVALHHCDNGNSGLEAKDPRRPPNVTTHRVP
jgi:hypothetical protein